MDSNCCVNLKVAGTIGNISAHIPIIYLLNITFAHVKLFYPFLRRKLEFRNTAKMHIFRYDVVIDGGVYRRKLSTKSHLDACRVC